MEDRSKAVAVPVWGAAPWLSRYRCGEPLHGCRGTGVGNRSMAVAVPMWGGSMAVSVPMWGGSMAIAVWETPLNPPLVRGEGGGCGGVRCGTFEVPLNPPLVRGEGGGRSPLYGFSSLRARGSWGRGRTRLGLAEGTLALR